MVHVLDFFFFFFFFLPVRMEKFNLCLNLLSRVGDASSGWCSPAAEPKGDSCELTPATPESIVEPDDSTALFCLLLAADAASASSSMLIRYIKIL